MLTTRPATAVDARAIAAIHVRGWQVGYAGLMPPALLESLSIDEREAMWRDRIARGEFEVWLAEDGDQAVGWIACGPSRDDDRTPTTGELQALYVDPDHWRRGAGALLWREAEARFRAAGMTEVTVWVLAGNDRASRFYRAVGFGPAIDATRTVVRGGAELRHARLTKVLTRA